jgi:HSP20 family protein
MNFLTRFDKLNPTQELVTMRDRMNRLFNQFDFQDIPLVKTSFLPPCDVYETKDNIVLKAEIPGMKKEDLELTIENGILTIKGEKKEEKETTEENFYRVERAYGHFFRTFTLPNKVNVEKIHAVYTDGILMVEMPKLETAKPKSIKIGIETSKTHPKAA